MNPEFPIEKQDFTVIKEKIIKTNELLVFYNEKNEKLTKATHAFKQLKSKYEAASNETNRLKIDNERLHYSLEAMRPKYEQNEKDLDELRTDYTRVDERYQKSMIESQLTISELEEKLKHCTCEKDLCLSPSKRRSANEKVKELKEICKGLKEVENHLKNENNHLQIKNKEFKEDNLRKLKIIQDSATKNSELQKDLAAVKNKVEKMELICKNQEDLQLTIASLKKNHEKEIHSLKIEISKLSRDNQRIKYLELECKNLKEQIHNAKIKTETSDFCVQTENFLENTSDCLNCSANLEKIRVLEHKCKKLKKKLIHFESKALSKQDIGIQTKIPESELILKLSEDEFLDSDVSVSGILHEMILPKALSPINHSLRLSGSPVPAFSSTFELLLPFNEESSQEQDLKPPLHNKIPNIVITPPTPCIEKGSHANEMFPVLSDSSERNKLQKMYVDGKDKSLPADPTHIIENKLNSIQPSEVYSVNSDEFIISNHPSESAVKDTHANVNWTSSSETLSSSIENDKSITERTYFAVDEAVFGLPNRTVNASPEVSNKNNLLSVNDSGETSHEISDVKVAVVSKQLPTTPEAAMHEFETQTSNNGHEISDRNALLSTNENGKSSHKKPDDIVQGEGVKNPSSRPIKVMHQLETSSSYDDQEFTDKNKCYFRKNELFTNGKNSFVTDADENKNEAICKGKEATLTFIKNASKCESAASTNEIDLNSLKIHSELLTNHLISEKARSKKESVNLKRKLSQHRRKFWMPYSMNEFVKTKKKQNLVKTAKIMKKYKEFPSHQPVQNDTILDALRTLQRHNINFTISNESIPLVQPYGYHPLITTPKIEPISVPMKFKGTFSYSLDCWNKKCTDINTQMLLRHVPNEEEPQLIGFYSVKDEVTTPSGSRMEMAEKPKPFDPQGLVQQLLSGIQELVDVKCKESSRSRRKRHPKSKNRLSDFCSETETELEKLFTKSADILGRNRRFLAQAKGHYFGSTEESEVGSESELMVDSGLVTATPKIDTDSLGFYSQYDASEEPVPNILRFNNQEGKNTAEVINNSNETITPPKGNEVNVTAFSSVSPSGTAVFKSPSSFVNKIPSIISSCTIPKFSACPDMLSPIASSKGSPETLQGPSTPLKTPSESNLDCFKIPFCPIMISPMTPSSKGSPPNQANSTSLKNIYEDSLDSFKIPLCPAAISPLNSFTKTSSEKHLEKIHITSRSNKHYGEENDISIRKVKELSNNDNPLHINVGTQNDVNSSQMLVGSDSKYSNKDCLEIKPYAEKIKSLIRQRITFDSIEDDIHLDQSGLLKGFYKLPSDTSESLEKAKSNSENTLFLTNISENNEKTESTKSIDLGEVLQDLHELPSDISKPSEKTKDNTIDIDTLPLANILKNRQIVESSKNLDLEEREHTGEIKMEIPEKSDDNSLQIDLSIRSSDLNCTLDDISISQLDTNSAMCKESCEKTEMAGDDVHLTKTISSNSKPCGKNSIKKFC